MENRVPENWERGTQNSQRRVPHPSAHFAEGWEPPAQPAAPAAETPAPAPKPAASPPASREPSPSQSSSLRYQPPHSMWSFSNLQGLPVPFSKICHPDPELAEGEGPAFFARPVPGFPAIYIDVHKYLRQSI